MSSESPAYTASSREATLPCYQNVEQNDPPPPSYDSLFGKVKVIRRESSGNLEFVKKIAGSIFGTIGFTIFLGITLAIPIAMIVIGAIYLEDCPEERYIPIYLIVFGSVGVVRKTFTIFRRSDEDNRRNVSPYESVLDCFMLAWFVAGNVWIYRTQGDFSTDPTAENYCHPTLYWFAFWVTTSVYIVMGCCCCCCCCCCVLSHLLTWAASDNQ